MSLDWITGPITSTLDDIENAIQPGLEDLLGDIQKYKPNIGDLEACVVSSICFYTRETREQLVKMLMKGMDAILMEYNKLDKQIDDATRIRDDAMQVFSAAQQAAADADSALREFDSMTPPDCPPLNDALSIGRDALKVLGKSAGQAARLVENAQSELDKILNVRDELKNKYDEMRKSLNAMLFAVCP